MKKYFQIIFVLGSFFFLVLLRNLKGQDEGQQIGSQNLPLPTPSQGAQVTPQTPSTLKGSYKNGTFTGSIEDAYYGLVQVQITINNGLISDVQFLQYPSDNRTSMFINSQAMPLLKSEALQAQSAQVDIVSGASDTSMAFQKSLAAALNSAK